MILAGMRFHQFNSLAHFKECCEDASIELMGVVRRVSVSCLLDKRRSGNH